MLLRFREPLNTFVSSCNGFSFVHVYFANVSIVEIFLCELFIYVQTCYFFIQNPSFFNDHYGCWLIREIRAGSYSFQEVSVEVSVLLVLRLCIQTLHLRISAS